MLELIINKTTNKATVVFDGKEQELSLVKVNKQNVKPGTYWVNMQPLGTPKKWATVNYNDHEEDIFTVQVDEDAHRVVTAKLRREINLNNIKDFLTEEQAAQFDELYAAAQDECARKLAEAEANKPVKEKKSRAMTPEQKYAKALAEVERLKKVMAGEIEDTPRKSKKNVVIENLDSATEDLI
jgi:hypothetical protein